MRQFIPRSNVFKWQRTRIDKPCVLRRLKIHSSAAERPVIRAFAEPRSHRIHVDVLDKPGKALMSPNRMIERFAFLNGTTSSEHFADLVCREGFPRMFHFA